MKINMKFENDLKTLTDNEGTEYSIISNVLEENDLVSKKGKYKGKDGKIYNTLEEMILANEQYDLEQQKKI